MYSFGDKCVSKSLLTGWQADRPLILRFVSENFAPRFALRALVITRYIAVTVTVPRSRVLKSCGLCASIRGSQTYVDSGESHRPARAASQLVQQGKPADVYKSIRDCDDMMSNASGRVSTVLYCID